MEKACRTSLPGGTGPSAVMHFGERERLYLRESKFARPSGRVSLDGFFAIEGCPESPSS